MVDIVNRDPKGLHVTSEDNPGMKADFSDVLGEPDYMHSMDCVWKNSYSCYNCGIKIPYKLLTFFTGIFLALYWGCAFGCLGYKIIWCLVPTYRMFNVMIGWIRQIFRECMSTFCGPCFETCGMVFSKIKVEMVNTTQ